METRPASNSAFEPGNTPTLVLAGVVIRVSFLEALDDGRGRLGTHLAHYIDGDAGEDETGDDFVQAQTDELLPHCLLYTSDAADE